ncbi:MAG: acetyltransferase [Candidatus Didemnitutus sp.]|nr:acetyltransferase [Candidatus Didemnitutus sp.]
MGQTKNLIIVGAGGAGYEALWIVRRINATTPTPEWNALGFVDDAAAKLDRGMGGVRVLGGVGKVFDAQPKDTYFHCAIGSNEARLSIARQLAAQGFPAATLIDPSAVVAESVRIGQGCFVGPLAFVGPQAIIGQHVLINTSASVGHDAWLADGVQVCPGARVSGHARMEEGAFLGSNAVVTPNIMIGAWTTVGACSLAFRDVPARSTVVGVPGKTITPPPSP